MVEERLQGQKAESRFVHPLNQHADHKLQPIADKLRCSMAQLSIAWCVKNQNVSAVITGASRPEQIIDNVKSLQFLDLITPEIMKEINEAVGEQMTLDPARQD